MTSKQLIADPLATFVDVFTRLAGQVHVVDELSGLGPVLGVIFESAATAQVAIAGLPEALRQIVRACCQARGIPVIESPFTGLTLPRDLDTARVGVTMAACAVAETGSIVEVTRQDADRLVSAMPRVHVCLVRRTAIVPRLTDAAPLIRNAFSQSGGATVTFISGPSRTGDIEMKLTLGVHGPEVMHAVIIE